MSLFLLQHRRHLCGILTPNSSKSSPLFNLSGLLFNPPKTTPLIPVPQTPSVTTTKYSTSGPEKSLFPNPKFSELPGKSVWEPIWTKCKKAALNVFIPKINSKSISIKSAPLIFHPSPFPSIKITSKLKTHWIWKSSRFHLSFPRTSFKIPNKTILLLSKITKTTAKPKTSKLNFKLHVFNSQSKMSQKLNELLISIWYKNWIKSNSWKFKSAKAWNPNFWA